MNDDRTLRRRSPQTGFALLTLIGIIGFAANAAAKPWWTRNSPANETDFLPPDVAFRLSSTQEGDVVKLRWIIADGYYLYRDRIEVLADSPDLILGSLELPAGTPVSDEFFGLQQIYTQEATAAMRFTRSDFGAHPLSIKVVYQGCAKAGLCYPPIAKILFPQVPAPRSDAAETSFAAAPPGWEITAILGGCTAFLLAGLLLRKTKRLQTPAP